MRILQVNVNRSKPAQDLARATAARLQCDVLVLSEPNVKATSSRGHSYTNAPKNVSIINVSRVFPVVSWSCGSCFVYVQLKTLYIFSCYISPNCSINAFCECLDELSLAIAGCRQESLLILGDFNAKNCLWGGNVTNGRGAALWEWASSISLTPMNDGASPTLVRHNGSSFID